MSADLEPGEKDFRSSYYYKSLHGFKAGEKSLSYLEGLINAEVLDLDKLKSFCLKHTLPVYRRPLLWSVLLGVLPVYTDNETTIFVEQQKTLQYSDLRHALQILGRIEPTLNSGSSVTVVVSTPHKLEQVSEKKSALHLFKMSAPSEQKLFHQTRGSDVGHSHTVTTSEEFVLLYLLENNRLLSAAKNQLKSESQVRLRAIAESFLTIFDEEEQVALYWVFSGFVKMCETRLHQYLDEMVKECLERLAEVDVTLYSHLKEIGALNTTLPLKKWFEECFASDLPESCIESVWDRVIAGSYMVLVFVAVAILLSIKRKILGLTSAPDLQHVLETIPKENFTAIVRKALELWESHGSPLVPCVRHCV